MLTTNKQRGRPFLKGQSGNPSGRPKGARGMATLIAETIMEGGVEDIVSVVVQQAQGGDLTAAKIVLDRLIPISRSRKITIDLSGTETSEGIAKAQDQVLHAIGCGEITPDEGKTLMELLDHRFKTEVIRDLEQRIQDIEANATA